MSEPMQIDPVSDAWARWVRDVEPAMDTSEGGFRAGVEYALAALPRMQPSEAEVERAARAMDPGAFATYDGGFTVRNAYENHAFLNAERTVKSARRKARAALATLPALPTPDAGRHWKHVKRGTTYAEIGRAELQASQDVVEGVTLVIYRGDDGKLWARQEDEFEDGRFEEVQREAAPIPTPDAAALRAEGFAAGCDAAWTLADRTWPEAHDLLDAIAALKPGGGT